MVTNNGAAQAATIETAKGIQFDFLNPQPSQVDIRDIAFSLANQSRFCGHTPFFSVAEHSVAVACRLPPRLQLAGLLHDASEAYLSDVPGPIKKHLPDYCAMEARVQKVIYETFSVRLEEADIQEIKAADKDATSTEAFYLLKSQGRDWTSALFAPSKKLQPRLLPPPEAFKLFMTWYSDLTASLENKLVVAR